MKYSTDILAVLVLYKIKLIESKSFLSLSASLQNNNHCLDLLVYDNSPDFNRDDTFNHYSNWNIIYQADTANSGVSKAYNTGAVYAEKMNKKWLLLLDQDTDFPNQTISEYLSAIKKYPDEKLFAPIMLVDQKTIISPCYFKFMRGFSAHHVNTGTNSLNRFSVINCGMCIDVNSFEQNHGYNEFIKLDFSDHDFIKRFKKSIGERFVIIDLRISHTLSSATKNSFSSDLARFEYYLVGAKHITASFMETFFLKVNAIIRSMKLSVMHHDFAFIIKLFERI